jgi:hypothetical protein
MDYLAFLQAHVRSQPHSVMRYDEGEESLWVKRAGALNPQWRYRVLGALARVFCQSEPPIFCNFGVSPSLPM